MVDGAPFDGESGAYDAGAIRCLASGVVRTFRLVVLDELLDAIVAARAIDHGEHVGILSQQVPQRAGTAAVLSRCDSALFSIG